MKLLSIIGILLILQEGEGYSIVKNNAISQQSSSIHRRQLLAVFGGSAVAAFSLTFAPQASRAFDGSGSTASPGRSPATKAELKRQYKERVVADVHDFNVLGDAIRKGETEGNSWVSFFIQFQRREADSKGRTYAALADLRGTRYVIYIHCLSCPFLSLTNQCNVLVDLIV
jgi:hypothetical protein